METVVIIGGGASGMMAALTAAEDRSRRVVLLERQQRVGRKLLATGNGRCNLTNTGAAAENYHGENADFVRPALEKFPPRAAMDYFASLGLLMTEEYGGRVYPLSNSANSVVDVLRFALDRAGVELRTGVVAREILRADGALPRGKALPERIFVPTAARIRRPAGAVDQLARDERRDGRVGIEQPPVERLLRRGLRKQLQKLLPLRRQR